MPYWRPLVVNGVAIDLSHLEPFPFQVFPTGSEKPATIHVTFNNHCFSKGFDASRHRAPLPATHVSPAERGKRGFEPTRYELSKSLPALVREFDGRRIAQTSKGTLVRIALADGRDYGIFFKLEKTGSTTCEMFVMSAYTPDEGKRVVATGEMRFNVAVALVLAGKKPKFPPGRF
jgi:hypothetical protein